MSASEYINTMVYGMLRGVNRYDVTREGMIRTYDKNCFRIPRIYCNDGFNISVQVNFANYCGSENGIRTFGLDWKLVEWGFPSEEIDGVEYQAEDPDNTMESIGGYVEIGLIDALCEKHGGIDLKTTLSEGLVLI